MTDSIKASSVTFINEDIEHIFVLCETGKVKLIIAGVYIPPNSPETKYILHCNSIEVALNRHP